MGWRQSAQQIALQSVQVEIYFLDAGTYSLVLMGIESFSHFNLPRSLGITPLEYSYHIFDKVISGTTIEFLNCRPFPLQITAASTASAGYKKGNVNWSIVQLGFLTLSHICVLKKHFYFFILKYTFCILYRYIN
jgi:hypothetical protein